MIWLTLIGVFFATFLIFAGKAMADICDNYSVWSTSVFSSFDKESFFGSKESTYKRKDHPNPIIDWLLHNPLVFVTDIWHTANTVRRLGIYSLVVFCTHFGDLINAAIIEGLFLAIAVAVFNMVGFHLMYHHFLRKK